MRGIEDCYAAFVQVFDSRINTAIKSLGGGYEGVGFAIPATRARRVAADLAEHGKVRRAYLGVQIGPGIRPAR